MSVQRYDIPTPFVSTNDPDGPWVLYTDHVAALAEAEQSGRSDAAAAYEVGLEDGDTLGYREGRAEALREAREAVAALPHVAWCVLVDEEFMGRFPDAPCACGISDALAAIDALLTQTSPQPVEASFPSGAEVPASVAPAGEDHGALKAGGHLGLCGSVECECTDEESCGSYCRHECICDRLRDHGASEYRRGREDALEEAEKAVLDTPAWNGVQASFQGEALGAIAALAAAPAVCVCWLCRDLSLACEACENCVTQAQVPSPDCPWAVVADPGGRYPCSATGEHTAHVFEYTFKPTIEHYTLQISDGNET